MKRLFPRGAGLKPAPEILLVLLAISMAACQTKTPSVTIALLGDLMLGRGVNPKPDSFAYLESSISSADLALANLESPIAPIFPASDSPYNLCTSSDRAKLLAVWGIDLVSVSNNHRLDCGPEGSAWTRSALEAAGITPIGPGMDPIYRLVNGLPMTFFAFEDITTLLDEDTAVQAVRSARLTGALVIVSFHWGAEYQGGISNRQESLAKKFAQAGAVLIWGHHPHVLQPAKWIQSPAGSGPAGGSTFVLYSLGNALFDQAGLDGTRQSALVEVTLSKKGVTSFRTIPFEIDISQSRIVQPDYVTAKKIRERLNLP